MPEIEIIFFDAGGTLLYPDPPVGEVYAEAAARHGVSTSPPEMEAAFRDAFHAERRDGIMQDREWWRGVVSRTFLGFAGLTDRRGLEDELFDHFAMARAWTLLPGAISVPAEFRRRGIRTGLLSNWDDRLPSILTEFGIMPGLEPAVVSCFVGAEKPDPRIFRAALDAAGVEPKRAVIVGDDVEADIEGARAVGMQAVLIDPRDRHDGVVPRVRCLTELPELLG